MNKLKQYLSGNMNEEDMEQITEKLLKQKFDREKKETWSLLLKEQYKVQREAPSKKSVSMLSIRRIVGVAAALGLLVSTFFLFQSTQSAYQQLADSYIKDLPIMADQLVFRKGQFQEEVARVNANEAYIDGNFELAIRHWQELVANNKANNYDRFYLGVSYLRQKESQPGQSIALLLQAKKDVPSLEQEINWILSLAYVQSGELDKARASLQSIVNEQAYMAEKAQKLLKKLSDI